MEFKQWQPLASHADTRWARYTIVTPGLRDSKMYHQKKQVSLSEQGLQSHFWSYWFWEYCQAWTQETPGESMGGRCWTMKFRTHCGRVVWCPRGLEAVKYRTHCVPGHYRTFVYASGCGFLGCAYVIFVVERVKCFRIKFAMAKSASVCYLTGPL